MSFALAIGVAALWARSWSHPATLFFTYRQERCCAWIKSGLAGIDNKPEVAIQAAKRERDLHAMETIGGLDLMVPPPSHVPAQWSWSSALLLPSSAIALAGIAMLIPIAKWARRRVRRLHHQCPVCGYNLTANTSGICPECGAPFGSLKKTAN